MEDLKTFYKGKRVFLTGHTGFKGTWLSLMLESLGAEVYGYALEPDTRFYPMTAPAVRKSYVGEITDSKKLQEAIEEARPEIVIHLASHSTLDASGELTRYIFDTNVMGVVNLLECVKRQSGIQAVLIVTSDKCYQNLESEEPYEETSVLGAQDPYSTSKACQELVTACYRNSFFSKPESSIPIATARASNVLGGGDYHLNRLLPSLLDAFVKGETAGIRNGDAVRPWQNVLDVLGGYLTLTERMAESGEGNSIYCEAYNFGPNADGFLTVRKLAEKLAQYFPNGRFTETKTGNTVKETKILKISSRKSQEKLGWKPCFTMDDTIRQAAEFAIRESRGESLRLICMEFIEEYWKRNKDMNDMQVRQDG
jgi:CDP-glucose 4,6-dehydratase